MTVSRADICCHPACATRKSLRFSAAPLCDRHAFDVFAEVRDTVDAATDGRIQPARPFSSGTHEQRPGFVYIAECGELIKIGYSATPRARVRSLGGRMVYYEPGTRQDEKALQHRFGSQWERGEYFRNEGDLAAYVAEVRGRHAKPSTHT